MKKIIGLLLCLNGLSLPGADLINARSAYQSGDYAGALESVGTDTSTEARLIRCLALLESYYLDKKNKEARSESEYLEDELEMRLEFNEIPTLLAYVDLPQSEHGQKVVLRLIDKVLDPALSPSRCRQLSHWLVHPDAGEESREELLDAIYKNCRNSRNYVKGGGQLPEEVKKLFQEPTFLQPVIDCLGDKKLNRRATDILEEVEEPALSLLIQQSADASVTKAIAEVTGEVARRQDKQPGSTWYRGYAAD